jgi:hypothetical protein
VVVLGEPGKSRDSEEVTSGRDSLCSVPCKLDVPVNDTQCVTSVEGGSASASFNVGPSGYGAPNGV